MKLAAYLKQTGLTYKEFAEKIGLNLPNPHVTLSRYSNGHRFPRKERAKQIIEGCEGKVTLEDLYG